MSNYLQQLKDGLELFSDNQAVVMVDRKNLEQLISVHENTPGQSLSLEHETQQQLKEICEMQRISLDEAIANVLNNQTRKELGLLKGVERSVRNVRKFDFER